MPLFNFNLLPVSEAAYGFPPSDPSQRNYSWYKLTSSGGNSFPVDFFLAEVESFHNRLMSAMAARIEEIETKHLLTKEQCDIEELRRDHRERIEALSNAKQLQAHGIDWEEVDTANKRLQELV
jgi:hypothetical protein